MRFRNLLLYAAMCMPAMAACSAVQVMPNGFIVRHEVTIGAPPAKVYETLLGQVGSWWDSDHTYSGNSTNLSIDPRPGGCFCERFPEGGGIEHMRILYLSPSKSVRMSGALGPLQASGLAGAMTWKFSGTSKETRLELSYSIGGFMDGGFERIGPAVEGMLGQQLQRLKLFVETGNPAAK